MKIKIGDIIECWGEKNHTYTITNLNPPLWKPRGTDTVFGFYLPAIQSLVTTGEYKISGNVQEDQEMFY